MKQYAAYKPSGVEWLGEVPAHWEMKRLKFVSSGVKTGGTPPSTGPDYFDETGISWYTPGDFGPLRLAEGNKKLNPEAFSEGVCKLFPAGSVLLVGIGATLGRIGLTIEAGGANQQINAILPLDNTLPEYLAYYLTAASQGIVASSSASTLGIINQEKTKQIHCLLPPLIEQRAIAAFLDERMAHLDGLIRRKEDLLKLLAEQRAALITRAVTRGLDAAAPLKESGVAWLGQVPAHWQVKRLKFALAGIEQGWSPQCDTYPAEEGEWGVMKVGCVNGDTFDPTENKRLPGELEPRYAYELKIGDVLVSRANTRELVGSAAIVHTLPTRLLLCDKLYRLEVQPEVKKEFLVYMLRSKVARVQYEREATGTSGSMQNIGQDTILNLQFALPPLSEQNEIVVAINKGNKRLDKMTDITNREIEKLREYRAALITAAVTGRIDVRAAVQEEAPAFAEAL